MLPAGHPFIDPSDDDRLWAALQDLDIPVNLHGGTGSPNYGRYPAVPMIMISEVPFYGIRAFTHMLLAGVFERFPKMKYVMTEIGASNFPPLLENLDRVVKSVQSGSIGELKYRPEDALPRTATEYFQQSVWLGASFPGPHDVAAMDLLGDDRFMWGSDYPHDEGTGPYTREHLRQVFCDVEESTMRRILGENAAKLYGFDLEQCNELAAEHGPTVDEIKVPLTELPENPNSALLKGESQLVA